MYNTKLSTALYLNDNVGGEDKTVQFYSGSEDKIVHLLRR